MSTQIAYDSEAFVIPSWTFADRLRKARNTTGLGQKDFAEQIGVKASAYAQWEADNNQPRNIVEVVTRIEDVTRIPASWLLGLSERATKKAPTANGGGLEIVHPLGLEPRTH
jgi:transcriptional regulator with XRE-family HTH domain